MNSWEEWKKNMGSWLGEAAQDTDRWARIGMRAYDRHGIQRDLNRHYAQLGRLVHPLLREDGSGEALASDARIRAEMGRIARLQAEMEQTELEIEALRKRREREREEARARQAAGDETAPVSPDAEVPSGDTVAGMDAAAETDTAAGVDAAAEADTAAGVDAAAETDTAAEADTAGEGEAPEGEDPKGVNSPGNAD